MTILISLDKILAKLDQEFRKQKSSNIGVQKGLISVFEISSRARTISYGHTFYAYIAVNATDEESNFKLLLCPYPIFNSRVADTGGKMILNTPIHTELRRFENCERGKFLSDTFSLSSISKEHPPHD